MLHSVNTSNVDASPELLETLDAAQESQPGKETEVQPGNPQATPRSAVLVSEIRRLHGLREGAIVKADAAVLTRYLEILKEGVSDADATAMRQSVKGWNKSAKANEVSAYKRVSEFLASFAWYYNTAGVESFTSLANEVKTYNDALDLIREERKTARQENAAEKLGLSVAQTMRAAGLAQVDIDAALSAATWLAAHKRDGEAAKKAATSSIVDLLLKLTGEEASAVLATVAADYSSARFTQVQAAHDAANVEAANLAAAAKVKADAAAKAQDAAQPRTGTNG